MTQIFETIIGLGLLIFFYAVGYFFDRYLIKIEKNETSSSS